MNCPEGAREDGLGHAEVTAINTRLTRIALEHSCPQERDPYRGVIL